MPLHLRQYWQAIKPLQGVRGAVLRLHLLTGGQRIEQMRQLIVEAASDDGHDYAPQKLEALETLHRYLTETSASVVHIASRLKA